MPIMVVCGLLAVALAAGAIALRRAAARVSVSDEGTIGILGFRVHYVGIVAKLAFLLGAPVPVLDSETFAFFPATEPGAAAPAAANGISGRTGHGTGKANEGGEQEPSNNINLPGSDGAPQRSDSRDGGLPLDELLRRPPGTRGVDTLVVSFSGGAVRGPGLPRLEFRRTLAGDRATAAADQVFVLDPTGMSFYEHSAQSTETTLRRVVALYRRVLFVGNCMGATGALRFCNVMRSAGDAVVAFNPEVDPTCDPRRGFRVGAALAPRSFGAVRDAVTRSVAATRARVRVHVSVWPTELAQARMLDMAEVTVEQSTPEGCAAALATVRGYRDAVRVVHADCPEHNMVGKVLRPSGALSALLADALRSGDGLAEC